MLRFATVATLLFILGDTAYADADIHTVLTNLRKIVGPLTLMVLWISYVAGIFFILRAIILMKKFGMNAMQQQGGGDLSHPMMYLFVGVVLLFIPSTTDVTMTSLFGQTTSLFSGSSVDYTALGQGESLMSYGGAGDLGQQWSDLANTLVLYIQFLGFLSFVKGWFIMSKAGAPGAQPGSISKGFTHIIGGIALVNIVGVIKILRNTIFGS